MSLLFCCVSQTKLVAPSQLHDLVQPLEENGGDCARVYGIEPPAVALADDVSKVELKASDDLFE